MIDTPTPADTLANRQRAFLLNKFATAKNEELTLKQAGNVPAWAKKQIELTADAADRMVKQMMADQLLVLRTVKGKDKIAITLAGRERLGTLAEFVPAEPPKKEKQPRAPKAPKKSLADQTAEKVRAKVDALGDAPVPASKLGKPSGKTPKPEATAAFEQTVRELLAEGKLFEYPGGKYGNQPPPPPPPIPDRDLREAYILDIFSRAKNRTIPNADIERALGKDPKKKDLDRDYPDVTRFRGQETFLLNPAATRQALEELTGQDYLEAAGTGSDATYTLTAAGVERLKDLREDFPVLPPLGRPATPDGAGMREQWEAFVLLHLLHALDHTAEAGAVYAVSYPKGSKLNDATAWKLRGELVTAGFVELEGTGDAATYRLTDAGMTRLAGLSFDAFPDVTLTGTALTSLLAAARGVTPATSPPPAATSATELEQAVMDIFHRLLRERHANIRMVPIHEVRAEIRQRFGEQASSREVFNDLLLDLRRANKIRLVSIDDRSRATEQQLQDSVYAVGETFFYLEAIHAPASNE